MTKTTTILTALAAGALMLATSAVQAEFVRHNTPSIADVGLKKVAGCVVTGGGAEFTNDVLLVNNGAGTIKAGDKIKWKVPGYGQGTHTLVADLSADKTLHLLDVLGSSAQAGETCVASVQ